MGCQFYHELGKKYGVETLVFDRMITLGSVMTGTAFHQTGLTLEDLGIGHLNPEELLDYLENGHYIEK